MKKASRVLLCLLVCTLLLPSFAFAAEEQEPVKVFLNGRQMQFPVDPLIEQGVTLVPFRAIFEALGLEVGWDGENQKVTGSREGLSIEMTLGNQNVYVNGRRQRLDVAPKVVNGTTLVPLRFVSEVSGKEVIWNGEERRIDINSGYELVQTYDPLARDSFIPLEKVSDHSNIKPEIYRDGDYLYVMWTKPYAATSGSTALQGYDFYLSVARNNQWLVRAEKVYTKTGTKEYPFTLKYFDGKYFIQEGSSISVLTPTKEGKLESKTFTTNLPVSTTPLPKNSGLNIQVSLDWQPIHSADGYVVLVHASQLFNNVSTTWNRLYYPASTTYNNFIDFKDIHGVTKSKQDTFYYDNYSRIMYLINGGYYRQLDIDSGDLKYTVTGQDLTLPFVDGVFSQANLTISNGKMLLLYVPSGANTYRFVDIDPTTLKPRKGKNFFSEVEPSGINWSKQYLYWDGNALQTYEYYQFSRKPAVKSQIFRFVNYSAR